MKRSEKMMAVAVDSTPGRARAVAFWLIAMLLVVVPLVFSTSVQRMFSAPKFAVLVAGAAALAPLLALAAFDRSDSERQAFRYLASKHVLLASLYLIAVSISTLFGVAPVASLFGSSYNKMGLVTLLCFFISFAGLIVSVGASLSRFRALLWAMAMTGLVVATYAYVQFFGRDPFIPARLYTYDSAAGPIVRVSSTLGHSNYLGNFLLYTAPLCAGLALAAGGRARRLGLIAVAVSIIAIVFSGTRGAWVGLSAGAIAFAALLIKGGDKRHFEVSRRRVIIRAGIALALLLMAGSLIALNPASRDNVARRARAFFTEGFTGAGRTLLWRDSIRMVPSYALTGCGPEGFRKAFLAYKSRELARYSPLINNESSHNSYLDSAINYGLSGATLYAALIASSFALLIGARRRATSPELRAMIAGLTASLVAVSVHNFFIFDQIPTGLYFFAFAALAACAKNVVESTSKGSAQAGGPRLLRRAMLAAGMAIAAAGFWHAVSLVRADAAINDAFGAAARGDLEQVISQGRRATGSPDPAGDFDFMMARALALCAERGRPEARREAIRLAIEHAQLSLARTLTPDSNHLLIAYLNLMGGDSARLMEHAAEAVKWDPNFSSARWLMAEAYLASGDRERAIAEAEAALGLNPSSREARRVLKRARAETEDPERRFEELMARARRLASEGKARKAQRLIRRANRYRQEK